MHKIVKINLTSIFSPICQTLLNEQLAVQQQSSSNLLGNCFELLVIRLQGTVIAFCTCKVIDARNVQINAMYFRNVLKDHEFAKYWLSRFLKKHLHNKNNLSFLLEY
jgi:hypothetical protein